MENKVKKIKTVAKERNSKTAKSNTTSLEGKMFSLKSILKGYFKFYKENLRRKHLILYIISLIMFFVVIAYLISKINSTPDIATLAENAKQLSQNSKSVFSLILTEKIPLVFMIIFAGIAPYFFIPVLGLGISYSLAVNIVTDFNVLTGKGSIVLMCIGAIIELIGIALAVASGTYYCIISTKRWKYSRNQDYSMLDFKKNFYEAIKNEKKLKETKSKQAKKQEKNEKNNVKVPYMYLIISLVISILIVVIGTVISKV